MSKYTAPVVLRCLSCGAPIRAGDKYHKLHIKGVPYEFCQTCVFLSDATAEPRKEKKENDNEN